MTREEALKKAINIVAYFEAHFAKSKEAREDAANIIEALEQEPTTKNDLGVDAVNREAVLDLIADYDLSMGQVVKGIHALPSVTPQDPKTGHCKDCKWWKDSDGAFRRGIGAESRCPINSIEEYENGYCYEVYEGNGYCYMFEPQESEEV